MKESEKLVERKLVELVKAAGRHLINNADNIVGVDDLITALSINVDFFVESSDPTFPTISVTREHVSREFMYVYENKELF